MSSSSQASRRASTKGGVPCGGDSRHPCYSRDRCLVYHPSRQAFCDLWRSLSSASDNQCPPSESSTVILIETQQKQIRSPHDSNIVVGLFYSTPNCTPNWRKRLR